MGQELINKIFSVKNILLLIIVVFGLFLRTYELSSLMFFISDMGWFYLSARDMLLSGNIPLVGITTSHTWLHQGALWTYILAVALKLGNFNPMSGAYLSVVVDLASIILIYKVSKELFSKSVGYLSALLYATSPLVISNSRMPYHTSVIPLLSILFLLFFYRWIKGNPRYFPLLVFVCSLLYGFELATILFPVIVFLFLVYGIFKKKKWAKIFNLKILTLSFFSFLIPMIPILIYDAKNGFPQTLKFFAWMILEAIGVFGIHILPEYPHQSLLNFSKYFLEQFKETVFAPNFLISTLIFIVIIIINSINLYRIRKQKKKENYIALYLLLTVLIFGFFSQRAESSAYMTMIFPFLIILVSTTINILKGPKKIIYLLILIILPIFNTHFLFDQYKDWRGGGLELLSKQAEVIVNDSNGKAFTLSKKNFKSNIDIDQYRYVVWWKGGDLVTDANLEYGIYNTTEGRPASYIYSDKSIYITKIEK